MGKELDLFNLAKSAITDSIKVKQDLLSNPQHINILINMAQVIAKAIRLGGKLLLCGNGGSAADAQHLATELLVRFRSSNDRNALPALALTLDPTVLTAIGNDYDFTKVFTRSLSGLGRSGDVLLGITTSGRSANIVAALTLARTLGIVPLGFLGGTGGAALPLCDLALVVRSLVTARIQESHIMAGHILVELIEEILR